MDKKGFALILIVFLSSLFLITGVYLVKTGIIEFKLAKSLERYQYATRLASDCITEIMRQFSQNPYEDHYSSENIERETSIREFGFTEVEIIPNRNIHTLFIEATGKYGEDPSFPETKRRLEIVIKFISDLTTYGTYLNGNFTTSASNVTYYGKMWINGNWKITGWNVKCVGGPVFVKGNITGNLTIDGDLYYGGSKGSGIVVLGNAYNYFPLGDFPTLDTEYYKIHYNYKFTHSDALPTEDPWWETLKYVRIDFNSDGTFTVNGSSTYSIPEEGCIIYGENTNIRVSGTVKGRVTVMVSKTSYGRGVIKVRGNLNYANGTHYASSDCSFAALAKGGIRFRGLSKSGMQVHGVYFYDTTSGYMYASNKYWKGTFSLYGTRNRGIYISRFRGSTIEFDPYLDMYPPPGLPERPNLTSWKFK
ncbi:MAG: hypothetical protein DRI36_03600 [Caldiserica bacterium]|nr:MAG: hypothetical protein DRI36_03600 [Caldisericota bacterium]